MNMKTEIEMNKKNKGFTSIPTDPFDVSYDAKRNMGKWQRFFSYYKPYKGLFFADMFFAIMGRGGYTCDTAYNKIYNRYGDIL